MGGSRHVAKDAAEAVEQGGWADDGVMRGEKHAVADLGAVVEDGAVG